jgi:ribosomal protein L19
VLGCGASRRNIGGEGVTCGGVHVRVEEVKEGLLDLFEIVVIANRNDALANALYYLRKVFMVFASLRGQ